MSRPPLAFLGLLVLTALEPARADGPADNRPEAVRRLPKLGIELSAEDRKGLTEGLAALEAAIGQIPSVKDPKLRALEPDVAIFAKAVGDALKYAEFFAPADLVKARGLLEEGQSRALALQNGQAPWTTATGLVVRGYRSRIDGSVQPYGLVVPESYTGGGKSRYRLDLWFHGRGETLSEVNFLAERMKQVGPIAPADTIVLHPYGRYCNAFKFAGEVDVLEALDDARAHYRIDDDRLAVRGFSMGGAACWQFATHYTDRWFAAAPGAGFAETARFLKVFQRETVLPTGYEQALWHLYDCTDWAGNLYGLPTVAYSGEIDPQKQAADVMAEALSAEGINLIHLIGPGTGHAYHPASKLEIDRRLDSIALKGRDRLPREVHLVTYTLKYPRMHWVALDALGTHWQRAEVRARRGDDRVDLTTRNVRGLTLTFPSGSAPFDPTQPVTVAIDGQTVPGPKPGSDHSWSCPLTRSADGAWSVATPTREPGPLAKRPGLQGPIDDAFMDSFVFVRPTGTSPHPKVRAWVEAEMTRAIAQWRQHFRGEARVMDDTAITPEIARSTHLILWGDPASNALIARHAGTLPIGWTDTEVVVGSRRFPAEGHVPILIYPNPVAPGRYLVLNSGFTFREYDYLNNARQVPKLPDWAIIDLGTPPDSRSPGKVVEADFFGEAWELKPLRTDP